MATTAPTSLKYATNLNQTYLSTYSIRNDVVFKQLFQQYGKGFYAIDLFEAVGQKQFFPYDERGITTIEEQAPYAVLRTGSAISTGSAGADISFTIHPDSLDANSNPVVRERDEIVISNAYMPSDVYEDRKYVITDITGTTVTARPWNKAGTETTASQISTEVPSGTYLAIGATAYAVGEGQPSGKTRGYATDTHYYRLVKDTRGVEGGAIAADFYEATGLNGNKGLLSKSLMEMEFDLQKQKAFVFTWGEANDNTSLTATSDLGGTNTIYGTKGLYTVANEKSIDYKYDIEPQISDLEYAIELQENKGVVAPTSRMLVGPQYYRDIQNTFKDEIRQFSGGSDLLDQAQKRLGVTVNEFNIAGKTFYVVPVDEFKDPSRAGLSVDDSYSYIAPNSALIVPDENVTMREFNGERNKTVPNVICGYVSHNGEDRQNVVGVQKGMSGFEGGMEVSMDTDGAYYYMMSHMNVLIGGAEKWILMRKRK
jgi:hypothetical protein